MQPLKKRKWSGDAFELLRGVSRKKKGSEPRTDVNCYATLRCPSSLWSSHLQPIIQVSKQLLSIQGKYMETETSYFCNFLGRGWGEGGGWIIRQEVGVCPALHYTFFVHIYIYALCGIFALALLYYNSIIDFFAMGLWGGWRYQKWMNFRKSSKRPLTCPPLIFGKQCTNILLKPCFKVQDLQHKFLNENDPSPLWNFSEKNFCFGSVTRHSTY